MYHCVTVPILQHKLSNFNIDIEEYVNARKLKKNNVWRNENVYVHNNVKHTASTDRKTNKLSLCIFFL